MTLKFIRRSFLSISSTKDLFQNSFSFCFCFSDCLIGNPHCSKCSKTCFKKKIPGREIFSLPGTNQHNPRCHPDSWLCHTLSSTIILCAADVCLTSPDTRILRFPQSVPDPFTAPSAVHIACTVFCPDLSIPDSLEKHIHLFSASSV